MFFSYTALVDAILLGILLYAWIVIHRIFERECIMSGISSVGGSQSAVFMQQMQQAQQAQQANSIQQQQSADSAKRETALATSGTLGTNIDVSA